MSAQSDPIKRRTLYYVFKLRNWGSKVIKFINKYRDEILISLLFHTTGWRWNIAVVTLVEPKETEGNYNETSFWL